MKTVLPINDELLLTDKFRPDYLTRNIMRKILLVLFSALLTTQVFAQKEPREYPWEKAAKRIEADEAKASKSKKTGQQREADTKNPEKKIDAENKKGK